MCIRVWSPDVYSSDLVGSSARRHALAGGWARRARAGDTRPAARREPVHQGGLHRATRRPGAVRAHLARAHRAAAPPRRPRPCDPRHDRMVGDLVAAVHRPRALARSEEHTSELQSLMRISYAVFCLKKKKKTKYQQKYNTNKITTD